MVRAGRANNGNSNVRGPNSALTEFLREKGVSAADINARHQARLRQAQADAAAAAAANGETTATADDNEGADENEDEAAAAPSTRRTRTSTTTTRSFEVVITTTSRKSRRGPAAALTIEEDEDEVMEDIEASTSVTKKKAAAAASKAKAKKAALVDKKKKRKRGETDDESDLDFFAPQVPVPGQIEFCAVCNCRFTVTPYSKPGPEGDGLLCSPCGKKSAPVEAEAKKKKQATKRGKKTNARALLDGDDGGVSTLRDMCVNIVAKHIDDVEALGDIGSVNMDQICQIISRHRSLKNHTLPLFLDPGSRKLSLYDCSYIDSAQLEQIAAVVPTLRFLTLKFCGRMTDQCLDYYGDKLNELTSIWLGGCFNVTEECYIRFIKKVGSRLTELAISDTSRFNVAAFTALADNCPNLETLRLITFTNINEECIRLLTALTSLKVLEISNPGMEDKVTDGCIIDVLNSCGSGLTELILDGCDHLTDATLVAIHETCGSLQKLSLDELELLTDEGFQALFTNWDVNYGLSYLNVCRATGFKDPGFCRMVDHSAKTLEYLSVNGCKDLLEDAWEYFSEAKFPHLDELDIGFVRTVNDRVIETAQVAAPQLKSVKIWGNPCVSVAVDIKPGLRLIGREADIVA